MQDKLKSHGLSLILIAVAILVAYFGIHQTFYQQDEWQEIGLLRSGVVSINPFDHFSLWQLLAGQGRTFSDLILSFLLTTFPYRMEPYAIFAILFHALNASLLYFLVWRLSGSRVASLVAAVVFATNAVANQTIIWVAAIATLPATTLIFLAIHSYLNFLETKKSAWLYWSLLAIFISLLFKEIGIFLVIFLPLLHLIWHRKPLETLKSNWPILAYGAVAVVARIIQLSTSTASNGTISTGGQDFLGKIIVHLILYPLTGIFQTLLPQQFAYALADKISFLQYSFITTTPMAEIVPQTILTDLISVIGTVALIVCLILVNKSKDKTSNRLLLVGAFLSALSFLPYAVLDRGGSYMDSRYYYVSAAGLGILLGLMVDRLWQQKLYGQIIAGTFLVLVLASHMVITRQEIIRQQEVAASRRSILSALSAAQPSLNEDTVYYMTGDQNYYILGNKIPFQQGIGYTLLVWYGSKQSVPRSFLADKFLWEMGSHGYKVSDGVGFGYFDKIQDLKDAKATDGFAAESVRAFYWDSKTQQLTDISDEVQSEIAAP